MSRSAVSGLQSALRLYESDKVRERAEGQARIREIFSNRDNLVQFQETASKDGGAGWIAFFQCLFQVVVLEKKACTRKSGGAQERSVHLIARKPFLSLVAHMTHLLVFSSSIFPPAALDYAKALRTLLSYPPHLDNLDQTSWKVLMGICWSALLGEEVTTEGDWEETAEDEEDGTPGPGPSTASMARGKATVTQATNELAMLIPVLLSSPNAPILPAIPAGSGRYEYEPSLGLSIVHKIQRFFAMHPSESASHLAVLRSLNLILGSLELNCRHDFVSGGQRILPHLVELWTSKSKAIREQVLIALRTLLPSLSLPESRAKDKNGSARAAWEKLLDHLPKETTLRWGSEPLNIAVVRLSVRDKGKGRASPFENLVYSAGHDFSHDSALRWAALDLYADVCFSQSAASSTSPSSSERDEARSKRRRIADPITSLIQSTCQGTPAARLLALQVLITLVDRHWTGLEAESQTEVRATIISLLNEDAPSLQTWAFIGAATLASVSSATPSSIEEADFALAWSHAIRKASSSVSRAACHAANAILTFHRVNPATTIGDILQLLTNVDIQGPPYPYDSVLALLNSAVSLARQDARLYTMNLENKVISWLAKWNALDGQKGKNRLDQHCPADSLPLLCNIAHLKLSPLAQPPVADSLPDGAVVDRLVEEHRTFPIRQFLILGKFEPPQVRSVPETSVDTALDEPSTFLDGRPRTVSDMLTNLLNNFASDWPSHGSGSSARPAIPPDRARKTVDMIVLALAYQSTLRLNGVIPDEACVSAAVGLLSKIAPTLSLSAYDSSAQILMWSGFSPLVHMVFHDAPIWPVFLKPDAQSGIRQNLLPPPEPHPDDDPRVDPLLASLWDMPTVAGALRTLCDTCLDLCSGSMTAENTQMHPGTQYPSSTAVQDDDDDFGEIRTAEADLIPTSRDTMDTMRTPTALLHLLASFRLEGGLLLSPNRKATKDVALVNAFLNAEGPRMLQLGTAICTAVKHGLLRLSAGAVDTILSAFEEMLSSYAYLRDTTMLTLTLEFMTVTTPIWLAAGDDLADRMIELAKGIHAKSTRGQLRSWKVQLALVMFVDEYLDYDPEMSAWMRASESQIDVEGASYSATDIISAALINIDMRVRFRAATSTAGLLYLSSIPVEQHLPFYHATVDWHPREPRHWDSFITDILWKLNCCITSPQLRTATIYHLYEVPPSTSEFNHHLQFGLETVAKRLGLDGITPLYLAHAPLVITSQVFTAQSPMRVPFQLYGFPSKKAFAVAALDVAGSSVLLASLAEKIRKDPEAKSFAGAGETLGSFCDAAGMTLADTSSRHFAITVARALSDPHGGLFAHPADFTRDKVVKALESLPGLKKGAKVAEIIEKSVEDIAVHLFVLLDLAASPTETADALKARSLEAAEVFRDLTQGQDGYLASTPALSPSASVDDVLDSLVYLEEICPSMSPAKVLFNALASLFNRINASFLVSEQVRSLRAMALVISFYREHMKDTSILNLFLCEMVPLLKMLEIGQQARIMLSWGLDKVDDTPSPPPGLDRVMAGIGSAYEGLERANHQDLCHGLVNWIAGKTRDWMQMDNMQTPLETAKSTWPEPLQVCIDEVSESSFDNMCVNLDKTAGVGALSICEAMFKMLGKGPKVRESAIRQFMRGPFWTIKRHLLTDDPKRGVTAFLGLLYLGHGQVRVPMKIQQATTTNTVDGRLSVLKSRPKENVSPVLQAAIVDKIVEMTNVADYKARSTALNVLQALLPHMQDLTSGPLLSGPGKDILPLLVPISSPLGGPMISSFANIVQDDSWIALARTNNEWSPAIARGLCEAMSKDHPFFTVLASIFGSIPTAARELLPLLVQLCLSITDVDQIAVLKERISTLSAHFSAVLGDSSTSTDTLRAIIDVILHLRHFRPSYRDHELGYEAWLDVDYMLLSEAALKCGSFVTSLMFLELTGTGKKGAKPVDLYEPRVQRIMYETYSNVEDPDGFYGVKTTDVGDALQRRLEHEGQYWRSFGLHSASLEAAPSTRDTTSTSVLAMRNLHSLGFNRVANAVYTSMTLTSAAGSHHSEPLLFELAWRTGDWDLPVPYDPRPSSQSLLYSALRAVHRERDTSVARKLVFEAIGKEIVSLRDCGVEKMTDIKRTTTQLLCLREIVQWLDPQIQAQLGEQPVPAVTRSRITEISSSFPFAEAERIIATRRSLLAAAKEREAQDLFGDLISPKMENLVALDKQCLLLLGEMARTEGNIQASINSLVSVQDLERGQPASEAALDEFSHVLWAQHEHVLAIRHVEERLKLVQGARDRESGSRRAVLLGRMAKWTSKAKLRAPPEVSRMFEDAVRLSQAHKLPLVEQSRLCHDYAAFADQQQAALYRSPDLERLNLYRDRKAAELRSATPTNPPTGKRSTKGSAKNEFTLHLQREIKEDEEAINRVVLEASTYAKTALKMYAMSLAMSDEHDDSTTRMCALWLNHDKDEGLNTSFERFLAKVPSHKFIFLSPQLAARLDQPKDLSAFNTALNGLVLRVCQQHPYHILYQVITLADGVKASAKDTESDGRRLAAASILSTIAADTQSPLALQASTDMRKLADAATSWCLSKSKEEENAALGWYINVPQDCPLRSLPKLHIPIATRPPPVDPLCKYAHITTIARYRSTYAVLGGLHRPKKMSVYDSHGVEYKELFKGEDELRQDAVMEQVFSMSNTLLERDRKTKERALRFRTYVVIPLARKTGIMEFVGNSQAIGDWLKPAHSRYGRSNDDIPGDNFRQVLKPLQEKEKTWNLLPAKFAELKQRFHPVMRHFFMEKHRDPVAWFSMRLNYTRSVAVTSMVGWMLGIGDRHCSNILIDQKTGELVHIDFGIVFEDGQRLRVPEKVPFRLTSDMVDGFGITGVDGTFRMCSEHTLRVLRESSELIMTVLEVFKHDPLYEWDADPEKLQRAQGAGRITPGGIGGTSASALEKADRILGTIRGKLRDDLSIEYTVNQLIQEARDLDNLAKIFVGWQPWF